MRRASKPRCHKGLVLAPLALLAIALPCWLVAGHGGAWGAQGVGGGAAPGPDVRAGAAGGPPAREVSATDAVLPDCWHDCGAAPALSAVEGPPAHGAAAPSAREPPPAPAAAEPPLAPAAHPPTAPPGATAEAPSEPPQPAHEASTTGLPQGDELQGRLAGKWFAWCHDGKQRNGQFWFLEGGKTKGDLAGWGLGCWEVAGPLQVSLHNCKGGNRHLLTFGCNLKGWFCRNGGQRGFELSGGGGFSSPEEVAAPTSEKIPDCFNPEVGRITTLRPVATRSDCNIFTLWDYPDGPPLFARLNLESWRRHSHGLCNEPILINDRNVMTYLPDMPEEYFRLPYVAAKSDAIRYGLLYHHGGIYFDSDFIVVDDLDPIISMLATTDLISYDHNTRGGGEACGNRFSSNFMGGRKGSILHKAVWEAQKQLLVKHCPLKDKPKEKVCCFDDVTEVCHIPWAGLGEWVSHAKISELGQKGPKPSTFCYTGDKSFVPDNLGKVLGDRLSPDAAEKHWKAIRVNRGLHRMMYHLFNAQFPFKDYTCEALFDNKTVASYWYRRSYERGHGGRRAPFLQATEDLFALHPSLAQHDADYGGGRPCHFKGERALPWARPGVAAS